MTACLILAGSCTALSNRNYVQQFQHYRGVRRIAVFVQHWPVYLQLPGQDDLGSSFIKTGTPFKGPWEAAARVDPRSLDVKDIDDAVMGSLLLDVLTKKGYQPFLADVTPQSRSGLTAGEIMARYQVLDSQVDAFLFCFYAPTVVLANPPGQPAPRSFSLEEILRTLNPGGPWVTWVGSKRGPRPQGSISHAFVYVSLTLVRAWNWHPLLMVADSQAGGHPPPTLTQCLPAPTDLDYRADGPVILHLMSDNLTCRLRHLIPDAI